jgi:hypothetical protein
MLHFYGFYREKKKLYRLFLHPSVHPSWFNRSLVGPYDCLPVPVDRSVHQSVGPSVRRSVGPSVRLRPSVRPSVLGQSVHRSDCPPVGPLVCRAVGTSVRLSVHPSARRFVHLPVGPTVGPSIRPSVRPTVLDTSVNLRACLRTSAQKQTSGIVLK